MHYNDDYVQWEAFANFVTQEKVNCLRVSNEMQTQRTSKKCRKSGKATKDEQAKGELNRKEKKMACKITQREMMKSWVQEKL